MVDALALTSLLRQMKEKSCEVKVLAFGKNTYLSNPQAMRWRPSRKKVHTYTHKRGVFTA